MTGHSDSSRTMHAWTRKFMMQIGQSCIAMGEKETLTPTEFALIEEYAAVLRGVVIKNAPPEVLDALREREARGNGDDR